MFNCAHSDYNEALYRLDFYFWRTISKTI